MVTEEEVVWMYRLLLGREPESQEVVVGHSEAPTSAELLRSFLQSQEFSRRSSALRLLPSRDNSNSYDQTSSMLLGAAAARIDLTPSSNLGGEPARLFATRAAEGFWERFVRPGVVVDIGYKGAMNSTPIFRDAVGLDTDTPGYDGRNLPYADSSIGTIHASHVLEHIPDYGFFLTECIRVLAEEGTLILFVPLMDAYERRRTPPSSFNSDHRRFYTVSRLLYEVESSLPRASYVVLHVRERLRIADLGLPPHTHAEGPYEIECVLKKSRPEGVY